jgi:hypothetical protein
MAQPPHGSVPPRFQQGPLTTALQLGPLAFLAGSWPEPGFKAIWRPDNPQSRPLTPPSNPTKRCATRVRLRYRCIMVRVIRPGRSRTLSRSGSIRHTCSFSTRNSLS